MEQDTKKFQNLIDIFFEKYVKGTGFEGITNYMHVSVSSNIKYIMEVHRNLYKYSQQGWDFLN